MTSVQTFSKGFTQITSICSSELKKAQFWLAKHLQFYVCLRICLSIYIFSHINFFIITESSYMILDIKHSSFSFADISRLFTFVAIQVIYRWRNEELGSSLISGFKQNHVNTLLVIMPTGVFKLRGFKFSQRTAIQ